MSRPGAGARVPVILNADAGLEKADPDSLADRLGRDRVDVRAVRPADVADAIRAAARDATIVGVAGGDGSMRTAASILAGTDTILACVPTGTLNHFARRVGIHDVTAAAAALRQPRVQVVPVGRVQDTVFLNTLTFGEYPRIVRIRERLRGGIGKWPAAAVAFLAALLTLRNITVRLHTADASLLRRTPFVWVGLGWGSFPRVHEALERRAEPDLEVTVLRSGSATGAFAFLVRLGLLMVRGQQPVRDRALDVLHTPALSLDSPHRIDATADGEVLRLTPPVRVTVEPGELRVLRVAADGD